ncbi:MAG: hypothetical protein AAF772_20720 [Acidobacteriota bacterium]
MRLTDLREQTVQNEGFRFAYLRKTRTPQEAVGLHRLMTAPFVIRYLLWCEDNMAVQPEVALPWALEAPALVAGWERCQPHHPQRWMRFKIRACAVRGTAYRLQGAFARAETDYQRGLLLLAEHRDWVPDSDAVEFYRRVAALRLHQDDFVKAQDALEIALALAERTENRDDQGCCHAMIGSMHLRASYQQGDDDCLGGSRWANREAASLHLNLCARLIDARKDRRIAEANFVNLATLALLESTTDRSRGLIEELDETRRTFVRRRLRVSLLICKFDWLRGVIYRNLGEFAKARTLLRACCRRFAKADALDTYLSATLDLIELERRCGKPSAVGKLARKAAPCVARYVEGGGPRAAALDAWHRACLRDAPEADRLLAAVRSAFGALPDAPPADSEAAALTAAGWAQGARASAAG